MTSLIASVVVVLYLMVYTGFNKIQSKIDGYEITFVGWLFGLWFFTLEAICFLWEKILIYLTPIDKLDITPNKEEDKEDE